jgi:serine/threonine-protein kinase
VDSLVPGTLLARRYRLLDRIGVGGMSVIWRAHDEMLERGVAVKVLATDLASDTRFRELVRTEARAAAALVHPHVTATYDYGETFGGDGTVTAYVVMELLEGEPLSARLTAGPLAWPEALRICAEVAEALAAAHRHGIVHRDITADNVMLTPGGAKVLDFGIATTVGAPDDDSDGFTFGTPAYVAPERLDGRRAKPATDTYALGVLLFETLTGHPPFPAETWEELAATDRSDPPRLTVPGLPEEVAALYRRCLALDPRARPSANQVVWTLRRHLPGAGRRGRMPRGLRQALAVAGAAASLAVGVVVGATLLSPASPTNVTPRAADDPPYRVVDPPAATTGPPGVVTDPDPGPGADPDLDGQTPVRPGGGVPPPGSGPSHPTREGADPDGTGGTPLPGATPEPVEEVTLMTVYQLVEDGRERNAIREDVALDLHQLIENLRRELASGTTDLSAATALLREKVQTRAEEGALAWDSAEEIHAALDQLAA